MLSNFLDAMIICTKELLARDQSALSENDIEDQQSSIKEMFINLLKLAAVTNQVEFLINMLTLREIMEELP